MFGRTRIQVEVREDYRLSAQYTPENLMREYFDSLLLEAEQKQRGGAQHAPVLQLLL